MMKNNNQLGMRKHGKGGHGGKSPKLRHAMKREAEAKEVKRKDKSKTTDWYETTKELFGARAANKPKNGR